MIDEQEQQYLNADFAEHYATNFVNLNEEDEAIFKEEHFIPGTYGFFELIDRCMVIHENFNMYCLEHPATALDKEIYTLAYQIDRLLGEFYQLVACKDWDVKEK